MMKIMALLLASGVFAADYVSKKWAVSQLLGTNGVEVLSPILRWDLAYNRGAAFSFLASYGGWQKWFFIGVGAVVGLFLLYSILRTPSRNGLALAATGLVLGGALGNTLDRLQNGYVVDFIHVHYQSWSYPIFNIADIGISLGVGLFVLDWIKNSRQRR